MYKLECGIPKDYKVYDFYSFLAIGSMGVSAVYINTKKTNDNGKYIYLVFPNGESNLKFYLDYIEESCTSGRFIGCGEEFSSCYNVEVTELVPTVEICAKEW